MKNDLLKGSPIKSILFFAFPIMLSSMLQYNYNLVDNIIVGRYVGTDALAAVGGVGAINSFIIGASLGLTAGFTIPVAQRFGAGDYEKMNRYAGTSISLALIIGSLIVVAGHILSRPLLRLINTPDEIIDMSMSYVNILYFAVPVQMSLNNFNALSRAVGDSKRPLYILVVSVAVNFCLDLLFVAKFGWGVKGAAFATAISQTVAATVSAFAVFRHKSYNIRLSYLKPDGKLAWQQIKMGIPLSLQFTITSIGSMAMQSAVNSFGTSVISGFTAAARVEQLTNIPMSGIGVGNMTFVSQNYGAGNYERIIKSVKRIFILDLIVSVICSIILLTAGPLIVRLFMTEYDEAIMTAAKRYLFAIAECYSLVAVLFVFRNTLQGLGFTYANTVAGIGEFIGRVAVAFIFTKLIGFPAVCYAPPFAWLLADIPLVIIYFNKEKKFKALIQKE
jgi:putative MATE family efflux protein